MGVSLKQEKPPRLRGLLLSKSGDEGQSRTDTGSLPRVFEFDAGRFTMSHRIPFSPVS